MAALVDDPDAVPKISAIRRLPVANRRDLAKSLTGKRDAESWRLLVDLADDRSGNVREAALSALAETDGRRARVIASGLLSDEHVGVRITAIKVLLEFPRRRYIPRIKEALRDADWCVRSDAAMALAKVARPDDIELLIDLLMTDPHGVVRRDIGDSLGGIGNKALIPVLEDALAAETDELAQIGILYGLYQLGQNQRLAELIAYLDDDHPLVRCNVVNSFVADHVSAPDRVILRDALERLLLDQQTSGVWESAKALLKALS